MQAVDNGALLFSACLDASLLQHHCRIKDWQYSLAERQVCYFCFRMDRLAFCMSYDEDGGQEYMPG
jgi:hypothetical protein